MMKLTEPARSQHGRYWWCEHGAMKTSSVEWWDACIRMRKARTDVTHPPSGLADFLRMCRHRFASIAVVAYVVDIAH